MERRKKQGIVDYSEPNIDALRFSETSDGSSVFLSDYDHNIDKHFINVEEFTVSYHGLVRYFEDSMAEFSPKPYTHIAISTEELSSDVAHKIVDGTYIPKREKPDSLKDLLKATELEYTLGYGVMASFTKKQTSLEKEGIEGYDLKALRALGSNAVRASLVEFIQTEISREKGAFISSGGFTNDDLSQILARPDVVSTFATQNSQINSAIIFADSPSVFPWFNEERIAELAEQSGQTYEDVHLAFLAFTSPERREKRVASALFDLAVEEVVRGVDEMTLCVECSPRSIAYVPFMIAKNLNKKWDLQDIVVERTKAVVYPRDIS